ncbi:two-component system response regulator NarL [Psychromonas sp. 14N.309.X.WAT.B.A12]|uniref:two-component system response regulator NarL n=1 Tax=unclassified Psychromonas TaxID=2614957 RepID=UPI0025AFCF94|nr:two-component system response regulator NarL [Psychromonas sp. 14N.309.X.WAT.B.A12]MDN2663194.1 two-component system response regulator NarL [Psychromonas sp. 14N.309.X.WAT.B.A12]
MNNVSTVIVVDDHPLMRKGVTQLLSIDPNFVVIDEATNGIEAVSMVKKQHPDMVLLDLNMKAVSGLETLKALRNDGISSKIVILTVSDAKQDVISLINQGADGYLLKDTDPEILLENLHRIQQGKLVVSEELTEYLDCLDQENNIREKIATLTRRESQIMGEISKGLSNKEISDNLNISEGTVKVHVKSLLKKLEIKSRVEAAVLFLEQPK